MIGRDRFNRFLPALSSGTLFFLAAWVVVSLLAPLQYTDRLTGLELFGSESLHRIQLVCQLSMLIVGFPLLLASPRFLVSKRDRTTGMSQANTGVQIGSVSDGMRAVRFLLFSFVLFLLGFPAVLLTGYISGASLYELVLGQVQLMGYLLGMGVIWWGNGGSGRIWAGMLLVGLLFLSVVVPVTYVALLQITNSDVPWLLYVAPTTSVFLDEPVGPVSVPLIQALLTVTAGTVIGLGLYLRRD